jgi:hypothetical protein
MVHALGHSCDARGIPYVDGGSLKGSAAGTPVTKPAGSAVSVVENPCISAIFAMGHQMVGCPATRHARKGGIAKSMKN